MMSSSSRRAADRRLVFVADDYDSAAEILACLVECESGYETVHAHDGAEAVGMARQRRPDAAIFDIDMPVMDGITAARLLGEIYGADKPILVAMTAGPRIDEARKSGLFRQVLEKPVDADQLVVLLDSLRE